VRVGLSGTPFPETPLDTFGVCRFLDSSLLGTSWTAFEQTYAVKDAWTNKVKGYVNQNTLRAKIDSIKLSIQPEGYTLPERVDVDVPLALPGNAAALYEELAEAFYIKIDRSEITIANAGVAIMRLQQLTSGYLPMETITDDEEEQPETTMKVLHTVKQEALRALLDTTLRMSPGWFLPASSTTAHKFVP
jgi:hypothetical protein